MRRRSDDWRFLARGELAIGDLLERISKAGKVEVVPWYTPAQLKADPSKVQRYGVKVNGTQLETPKGRRWRTFPTEAEAVRAGEKALAAIEEAAAAASPAAARSGILSRAGFDHVVRHMVGRLTEVTGSADAAALRRAAKILDRKWDAISVAERDRVIAAAAQGFLAVPKLVIPKVETILKGDLRSIVEATKAAVGERHGLAIAADLSTQDRKIVDFAASSQGSYITDQYGVRATAYEQRARDIVADGLDKGLGRADIADMLRDELTNPMLGRAASYWDQVASIHVARARSYAQLSGYTEAGIERYQNVAAFDEVTCVICRFMDGKEFDVETSVDRFHEVEGSGDPYAVTELQPFVRVGRTEDGDQFLYAESRGGKSHFLAEVVEDATGERDEPGRYGRQASESKMQSIGVTEAPFHGRCRCTTEPV